MSHFFSSNCCLGINSLGNHATTNFARLATCPLRSARGPRQAKQRKPALRTRLVKIALALAVLYVVFVGERWVLEHSATAAEELIVATSVADAVTGAALPASFGGGDTREATDGQAGSNAAE